MTYTKLNKAANFIRVINDQSKKRFKYYKMDFIFTLRKRINFRRQKRFKDDFLLPRLLYNFYLIISRRNFMKISIRAKKRKGYYIENYLGLLEGRLFMMVYRCHLVSNLFIIRYIVKHNMFWVNEKIRVHSNSIMKPGDVLWFGDKQWKRLFKRDLTLRVRKNVIMWPIPRYLIFSTKFMFVIFWRFPKFKEIVYPAGKIDIYLANEYHII
jgi:ribosomal protein S4